MKLLELTHRDRLEWDESRDAFAVEKGFGITAAKRLNHVVERNAKGYARQSLWAGRPFAGSDKKRMAQR
jgi:hypothetical protein